MRRGKDTTFNQRQLVIFHHTNGKTVREIAEILIMKRSTVGDIISRYKNEDRIDSKDKTGAPKKLSIREQRNIVLKVQQNPKLSAPKLAQEVKTVFNKEVSASTIRNILRQNGFNGRVSRKKPYVNALNRKRRVQFARNHENHDYNFWKPFIFADESKYNIFGSDGRTMVWRKTNDELNPLNIRGTVKFGGGSVMVWGCMSYYGVGPLVFIESIMDHKMYLQILRGNMRPYAHRMGIADTFSFYQDNDPKHKAIAVQKWLGSNCPNLVNTPAQSPDLNPIENLWSFLESKIRNHPITNKEELKKALQEEWAKIPLDYVQGLVESMPRRLEAVKRNKGYPTKY